VRLDMSELSGPDAVARLIGDRWNPRGLLTERIREQPFSLVLLDEIEKAHPAVLALLLQLFDEGRLTDAAGEVASFASAVVIATSNLGFAECRADRLWRRARPIRRCREGGARLSRSSCSTGSIRSCRSAPDARGRREGGQGAREAARTPACASATRSSTPALRSPPRGRRRVRHALRGAHREALARGSIAAR
jgi:hypothetical protein